jgi:membrane associated rhomboid family serine protease
METPVRRADGTRQADEWALVLAAAGIPHRLAPHDDGVWLIVPGDEAARAEATLDDYERELLAGHANATALESTSARGSWVLGASVAGALVAFFSLIGPPEAGNRWFERGAASAARIVGGEPWRAVTALTLHLDAVHVASNAVASVVLVAAVAQRLGPGLGLALTVFAGAAANVLGALVHDAPHSAIGASTATFGAIGLLAGLRMSSRLAIASRGKPWIVLAAAVVLLAMLGTSKGADITGHALGLACGVVLGVVAGVVLRRPPPPLAQWMLGAVTLITIVGGWMLALSSPE